ncbi:MAG: Na+/H+ antiporter NhaA [Solirubrobacterales bacterium]
MSIWRRAKQVLDPAAEFLRNEAIGGAGLLIATAIALIWVNGPASDSYESLWTTELTLGFGDATITEDLRDWVNDGLMTLFFFVIALEIKRELVTGELNDPKAAALPVIAALGGALLPALLFLAIAGGEETYRGWSIPIATDAAFAVGVLVLLGNRVSTGVKLFLVTIAVVDDVAAIIVIAVAYTADLSLGWLALAVGGLGTVVAMRRLGVTAVLAYVPVGLFVWLAMLESGVHPTIAGVALALLTPARPIGGRKVLEQLEERIHPLTSLLVLPLFALANAGVELSGDVFEDGDAALVAIAVAASLVAGKLIGISVASLAALRAGVGTLPDGVDLRGVLGVAALGGIGFTVSLFITPLAYDDPALVSGAKIGILGASLTAAAIGTAILLGRRRKTPAQNGRSS